MKIWRNVLFIVLLIFVSVLLIRFGRKSNLEINTKSRNYKYLNHSFNSQIIYLNRFDNEEYYGIIYLGTPPQQFRVIFSTGVSHFLVVSKKCRWLDLAHWNHKTYDSSKSSTYKNTGENFSIDYHDRKSYGFISRDTMKIGHLIINNQTFGEATKLQGVTSYFNKFDGILGLGISTLTKTGISPLISMIKGGILENKIFSFFIERNGSSKAGAAIILGGWDEKQFNLSSVDYIPLADNTAWLFDMEYVTTDGEEQLCYECQAIAETGTAFIVGHENVVKEIHRKLGANIHGDEALVDCSLIDKLPAIIFRINKRSYQIKGPDYVLKTKNLFSEKCRVGIIGSKESTSKPWILGNIFLQKFYNIFDIENKRIAFADLR